MTAKRREGDPVPHFELSYAQADENSRGLVDPDAKEYIPRTAPRRADTPCELVDATPGERTSWQTYYLFRRAMLRRLAFAPRQDTDTVVRRDAPESAEH